MNCPVGVTVQDISPVCCLVNVNKQTLLSLLEAFGSLKLDHLMGISSYEHLQKKLLKLISLVLVAIQIYKYNNRSNEYTISFCNSLTLFGHHTPKPPSPHTWSNF